MQQRSLARAQPDGLDELARLLTSRTGQSEAMARLLRTTVHDLAAGDWRGRSAGAFADAGSAVATDLDTLAGALHQATAAIACLTNDLRAAQTVARLATDEADDINWQLPKLEWTWEQEQALGAVTPSPGLAAWADGLHTRKLQAEHQMTEACQRADEAFARASRSLASIAGDAPLVRAAAEREPARQSVSDGHPDVVGGALSLLSCLALSGADVILALADGAQGGLDPLTDGLTAADAGVAMSSLRRALTLFAGRGAGAPERALSAIGDAATLRRAESRTTLGLTSTDPGVTDVARAIEEASPGNVIAVNVDVLNPVTGKLATDFDIETQEAVIQMKIGKATGLGGQLRRTQKLTTKVAIGYAPNAPPAALAEWGRQGLLVTDDLSTLLAVLAR